MLVRGAVAEARAAAGEQRRDISMYASLIALYAAARASHPAVILLGCLDDSPQHNISSLAIVIVIPRQAYGEA